MKYIQYNYTFKDRVDGRRAVMYMHVFMVFIMNIAASPYIYNRCWVKVIGADSAENYIL